MGHWPWPRDTHEDRLKRIIDSYRTALMESDPATCRILDARMAEYGQGWIGSELTINLERLITAQEMSAEFDVNPWNVKDWARRHPDQIPKCGETKDGKTLYRLGDIIKYQANGGQR